MPKRQRKNHRRRRTNKRYDYGTFRFRTIIPNSSSITLNARNLTLAKDRSYRPLYLNIQMYSTVPSLLQFTLFESTAQNAVLKIVERMIGPNPTRITLRWPRSKDFISPSETSQSFLQVDNICLRKEITDNVAVIAGNVGIVYSPESYSEACKLISSVPTESLEDSFTKLQM